MENAVTILANGSFRDLVMAKPLVPKNFQEQRLYAMDPMPVNEKIMEVAMGMVLQTKHKMGSFLFKDAVVRQTTIHASLLL